MSAARYLFALLPLTLGVAGTVYTDGDGEAWRGTSDGQPLDFSSVSWPELDWNDPLPTSVFGVPAYSEHDEDHAAFRDYLGFSVYYDDRVLAPRWTAIKLTAWSVTQGKDVGRLDRFVTDSALGPLDITRHEDYNNAPNRRDWSRGHMVRFDDARGWGEQAAIESFFTSNVTPQLQAHNNGAWFALEELCAEYAAEFGTVWVYTGPVYPEDPLPFIPGRRVPAPESFFKVLVAEGDSGSVDVLAFLVPHEPLPRSAELGAFLVSVDEVEELTGIDFLAELPPDLEEALEVEVWELWPSGAE